MSSSSVHLETLSLRLHSRTTKWAKALVLATYLGSYVISLLSPRSVPWRTTMMKKLLDHPNHAFE
jgi:hypothetical protein